MTGWSSTWWAALGAGPSEPGGNRPPPPPHFGGSVNHISIKGADYANFITYYSQIMPNTLLLCVEMEFYTNISWQPRNWNKCLSPLLWDFDSFWSTYLINLVSKGCLEETKTTKVGKGCLKVSFFLRFRHWWNHLCERDWLGVGKDIRWILKFYKNELRL